MSPPHHILLKSYEPCKVVAKDFLTLEPIIFYICIPAKKKKEFLAFEFNFLALQANTSFGPLLRNSRH